MGISLREFVDGRKAALEKSVARIVDDIEDHQLAIDRLERNRDLLESKIEELELLDGKLPSVEQAWPEAYSITEAMEDVLLRRQRGDQPFVDDDNQLFYVGTDGLRYYIKRGTDI